MTAKNKSLSTGQSVSLKVLLQLKRSSSSHMLHILFVAKMHPTNLIALNTKHEQTLNNKKSVKSLLNSRFHRTQRLNAI